jgi:hypothetical protein
MAVEASSTDDRIAAIVVPPTSTQIALQPRLVDLPARIETPQEFAIVAEQRELHRQMIEEIERSFKDHKRRAREAHLALCKDESERLAPELTAIESCDRLLVAWHDSQRQLAAQAEEQDRALADLAGVPVEEQDILPTVSAMTAPEVTRAPVGFAPKTEWSCTSLEAFVLAIARPIIYQEVAGVLQVASERYNGARRDTLITIRGTLLEQANSMPRIPFHALAVVPNVVRSAVTRMKDAFNWPGIVVGKKTGVRRA